MAEVARLALGVVGVAGLHSVVLQVVEQISDAASFNTDFTNQKIAFKYGEDVLEGLRNRDRLGRNRDPAS
jgi:hypothetical protein